MPFQTHANYSWPAGFPGRIASANPMRSVVSGSEGFRAGYGGVTIGAFAWIDADGTTVISRVQETGSGAAGTAVLTAAAVSGVTITNGGSQYDDPPAVTFTGGGGAGAAGTAVVSNGVVTGVTITAGGTGYTSAPTVAFAAPVIAGSPSGFVYADQQGLTTQFLQESTMLDQSGYGVGLAEGGDFFAVSTTAAVRGQAVFASLTTTAISTGTAGSPPSGSVATGWIVSQGGPAGSPIIITGPQFVTA